MLAVAELAPDLSLTGGVIHTVSDRGTVSALAVKGGRIVWVGPTEAAAALAGARTRVVNLRGLTILPGFVDSHNREAPLAGEGWAVEHAILATPEQSRWLRDLGVFVTAQSVHLWTLGQNMVKHWGPARANAAYPQRTWLDLGVRVAGGTDANVCPHDQLLALYVDVTRETEQAGPLGQDEAIPPDAALRCHTQVSADCLGIGRWAGSLEPNKVADFTVVSDNPLSGPPDRIRRARILATVVGGRVVHRRTESPL